MHRSGVVAMKSRSISCRCWFSCILGHDCLLGHHHLGKNRDPSSDKACFPAAQSCVTKGVMRQRHDSDSLWDRGVTENMCRRFGLAAREICRRSTWRMTEPLFPFVCEYMTTEEQDADRERGRWREGEREIRAGELGRHGERRICSVMLFLRNMTVTERHKALLKLFPSRAGSCDPRT